MWDQPDEERRNGSLGDLAQLRRTAQSIAMAIGLGVDGGWASRRFYRS